MQRKQSKKSNVNYAVDAIIAVGFLLVLISGIVLLIAGPGGYQGGRNPHAMREVLSLSRWTWKAIHDWGAIALAGGVFLHLALHWKWIICMTRNLFARRRATKGLQVETGSPLCDTTRA